MEEKNEYVIVLAMVYTGSHHSYYWNRKTTKKRKTTIKVISGESLDLQEELNNRQAVVMPAYIGPITNLCVHSKWKNEMFITTLKQRKGN